MTKVVNMMVLVLTMEVFLRKLVDVEDDNVEDVDVEDVEVEDVDVDLAGACGVEDGPVLPEDLAGAFGDELTEA